MGCKQYLLWWNDIYYKCDHCLSGLKLYSLKYLFAENLMGLEEWIGWWSKFKIDLLTNGPASLKTIGPASSKNINGSGMSIYDGLTNIMWQL
jgi:hypothetical protein